jgi:hypothetical protein
MYLLEYLMIKMDDLMDNLRYYHNLMIFDRISLLIITLSYSLITNYYYYIN